MWPGLVAASRVSGVINRLTVALAMPLLACSSTPPMGTTPVPHAMGAATTPTAEPPAEPTAARTPDATPSELAEGASTTPSLPAGPDPKQVCGARDEYQAGRISQSDYDSRPSVDETQLIDLNSSKEQPVKMCGANDSYAFVAQLRCEDGAVHNRARQPQRARVGNVGPGGQCDNIIDLYRVRCSDGNTHEIFIDMYWCPLGRTIFSSP